MYSKEEIEKKREQALLRKKHNALNNTADERTNVLKNVVSNHTNQNAPSNSNAGNSKAFANYFKQSTTPSINKTFARENFQSKTQSAIKTQTSLNRFSPISTSSKFYGAQPSCEVSCSMISSFRFAADTSTFHPTLIELFKTIPSKLYDTKTKIWNFHINDYDLLHEKVISLKSEVSFKGLPFFVLKLLKKLFLQENDKKMQETKNKIDLSKIDPTLLKSLYDFQREGIEYGVSKNGKCLIADDMGLGKTRQALGIAHYYKEDWPLLIITPSSVRYQWSEAIIENLPSVRALSVQHILTQRDYIDSNEVTILSYDLLTRRIDELSVRKFGVVICDESHYLKSGKTQRTKAVTRLAAKAHHLILLTGTPALSRPIELHAQISLLMPSFMSYQDFGIRYCAGTQSNFGWDFTGSSNLKELEILLKACCMIRRLKSDVMTQLPTKIRQKVILDPFLIKVATKEMTAASQNMTKKGLKGLKKQSALLQYYSETSKAKEKAVCNYISYLIENQQKFLVFAHHQIMLDAICNLLTSKKIMFIRIDGKTNPEQRKNFVDLFQQNDNVLVAVLSITAANAGITMTTASLVIFAELSWNPGILRQAEDRVHRIGQTDNVVIRYLLAQETADDYMWPVIQQKIDVLNEFGLDQNFDLDEADVTKQSPAFDDQQSLDNFVQVSPSNSSILNTSGNVDLHISTDNLKGLLDVDDDAFDDIDLDCLAGVN